MRILIYGHGNSCRTQLAAGLISHYASAGAQVQSAGEEPKAKTNPHAVFVMSEIGIDISGAATTNISEINLDDIDALLVLSPEADTSAPRNKHFRRRLFWPIQDPEKAWGDESGIQDCYREVREELRNRVVSWLGDEGLLDNDVLLREEREGRYRKYGS